MKHFILFTLVLSTMTSFSQKKVAVYIELRGNVDILGNIYLDNITQPKKPTKTDSLIHYSQLTPILNLREPIKIINTLSEVGWTFISVTQVSSDKEGSVLAP